MDTTAAAAMPVAILDIITTTLTKTGGPLWSRPFVLLILSPEAGTEVPAYTGLRYSMSRSAMPALRFVNSSSGSKPYSMSRSISYSSGLGGGGGGGSSAGIRTLR